MNSQDFDKVTLYSGLLVGQENKPIEVKEQHITFGELAAQRILCIRIMQTYQNILHSVEQHINGVTEAAPTAEATTEE